MDDVVQAYRDADYWRARLAAFGVDSKLESLRANDDAVEVVTLQVVPDDALPGLITQVHRGDLCIRRAETWGPVRDGVATAAIEGSIEGAPAQVSGTAKLSPTTDPDGSRLDYLLTVEVNVPLIGGKLENFIGAQLANLVAAEQLFTTAWLTDNA